MISQGWIKLSRSIMNKGYYKNSMYVHLWIHLLMKASHTPKEFFYNGQTFILNPGQFVTGRKKLSSETGIHESSIQRILKTFENEHQIEQQTNSHNRLITIVNWEKYQDSEQQSEQLVNNQRTTSEQLVNTIKNEKNEKNVRINQKIKNLKKNEFEKNSRFDTGGTKNHQNDRL